MAIEEKECKQREGGREVLGGGECTAAAAAAGLGAAPSPAGHRNTCTTSTHPPPGIYVISKHISCAQRVIIFWVNTGVLYVRVSYRRLVRRAPHTPAPDIKPINRPLNGGGTSGALHHFP